MATKKLLFLTLHTFSLTGGIEKVCRILSKVFTDGLHNKQLDFEVLRVLSLCDDCDDVDLQYCHKKSFKGYKYSKAKFGIMAVWHALTSTTIVLSHINLLPLVFFVKRLFPSKKVVLLAHGIEVWRDIKPWKINFLQKHVDIWAVSHFTAEVLHQKHQISKDHIAILNNCIDPFMAIPSTFEKPKYLTAQYQLKQDQLVMMTISRLSSSEVYKGYDLVIEAMPDLLEIFPNLTYVLAGKADKKEKARLQRLIQQQKLEAQIILADFIPNEQLIDHFLLADVFVMPSKKEGFGIVFIEAAACGCPVIAGNKDGSRDALLNGELGQLIDPESKKELIAAVQNALANQRNEVQSLKLQQKCLAHFNYTSYQHKVFNLLAPNNGK